MLVTLKQAEELCPLILGSVRDAYPDATEGTVVGVLEQVLQVLVPWDSREQGPVPLAAQVIARLRKDGVLDDDGVTEAALA